LGCSADRALQVLKLRGVIIDTIDVIVPPPSLPDYNKGVNAESYLQGSAGLSAWLRRCRELTQQRYGNPDEAIDAFWRTLICNCTNLYKRPGSDYLQSFQAWSTSFSIVERWMTHQHPVTKVLDSYMFRWIVALVLTFVQLMRIIHILDGRSPAVQFAIAMAVHVAARYMQTDVLLLILRWITHYIFVRPQQLAVAKDIDTLIPATHLYSESFGNFISGRTFCTTKAGRVGLVHIDVVSSDQVVIFCGSPLPFILRKAEGGMHTLVGDAYIHGCMEWSPEIRNDGVLDILIT
jgi:hypothetical protein